MSKKKMIAYICALALSAASLASASAVDGLETDTEIFAACVAAAGWSAPAGYALEGFRRIDLNSDTVTDAVAVLRRQDGERLLVVMLSGESGYQVMESRHALPSVTSDGTDPLQSLLAENEQIALYTVGGDGDRYARSYAFSRSGNAFYLSAIASVEWNEASGSATRVDVGFDAGELTVSPGKVENNAFIASNGAEQYTFDAGAYRIGLDSFDVSLFWDHALQSLDGVEQPEQAEAVTASVDQPGMIFCNACGGWFQEGEEFRGHACVSEDEPIQVRCEACGGWFLEEAFAAHECAAAAKPAMQCPVCGDWFEEGAAFMNHVCVSDKASDLVYCDVCKGWYEEGDAFRNHECPPPT